MHFMLAVAAMGAFVAPACAERLPDQGIDLGQGCELRDVFLGVGEGIGRARPGTWTPLRFTLRNTSSRAYKTKAQLSAPSQSQEANKARYIIGQDLLLELPPHSERAYDCMVRISPITPDEDFQTSAGVDFRVGSRLTSLPFPLDIRFLKPDELQALLVRSRPGFYALGRPTEEDEESPSGPGAGPASWRITSSMPEFLPQHCMGYSSVDCVLWDSAATESLSPGQRESLRQFVIAGGHLALFSGKDWEYLKDPLFEPMLPVARLRTFSAKVPEDLVKQLRETDFGPTAKETAGDAEVSLSGGEVRPKAQAIHYFRVKTNDGPTNVPIAWQWPCGAGTVTLLAFSSRDPIGKLESRQHDLWKGVIYRSRMFASSEEGLEWRQHVEGQLRDSQRRTIQPRSWVGRFLLFYVVALVPANFLLFRLLKRVNCAWLAGLGIATAFAAYAYQHDTLSSGALKLQMFNVVRVDPESGLAEVKSYLGLFSPVSRTYHLEIQGGEFCFSRIETSPVFVNRYQSEPSIFQSLEQKKLEVVSQGFPSMAKLHASARSTETVQAVGMMELAREMVESLRQMQGASQDVILPRVPTGWNALLRNDLTLLDCRSGPFLPLKVNGATAMPIQEVTFFYSSPRR